MTTDTASPVAARRRPRGYLRAVLLLPVVLLTSLGLVFGSGTAANAWAAPPAPVVIQAATKAAPLMAATANPVGLAAAGVAFLGIAAYETKDSWMPVLKNWLNPTEETNKHGSKVTGMSPWCTATSQSMRLVGTNGGEIVVDVTCNRGGYPEYKPGLSYYVKSTCRNTEGTGVQNGPEQHYSIAGVNGPFVSGASVTNLYTLVLPVNSGCAAGFVPVDMTATPANSQRIDPLYVQEFLGLNGGIPDGLYSQTTTVQCRQPDGSMVTITDSLTGQPDKIAIPSCAERVPGSFPWSVNVKGGPSGVTPKEHINVTTKQDVFDQWQDCFGPTGLVCQIRVFVDGQACNFGDAICANWKDLSLSQPQRVECRFGSHVVGIGECGHLKRAYTKVHTVTQADPKTGDPITDPDVKVGTPTTTDPLTPVPNPETVPEVSPDADPNSRNCFGDAVSFNPVNWVYIPVKCAFIWAFKPKTQLSARVDTIKGTLTTKAPFSWFAGFATVPAAIPGGACPDWRVKVGTMIDANVVCDSSYTDAIRAARPVLLVFMASLALWPLIRSTAYAAFPIIKPSPGVLR